MLSGPEELEAVRQEATPALAAWDLDDGEWRVVGAVPGSLGSELRPVIAIGEQRYLVRRQPPDLREQDIQFRHDFTAYLHAEGLPVPALRPRPGGGTYALVAGDFYELQEWREGVRYQAADPAAPAQAEAAAATLGMLHQASTLFEGEAQRWPEERSPRALAQSYVDLLTRTAEHEDVSPTVAAAVARVAAATAERVSAAAEALVVVPGPPELHIHGDYQPRHLAFAAAGVAALYDFDAVRWARRLDELAYALLCFTGIQDAPERTAAPLADDGLDVGRAHAFLRAYGMVAPPAEDEADVLGDAITLAFPVLLANGIVEDLVFAEDFGGPPPETEILPRLAWAEAFWVWLDRYRGVLAETWRAASRAPVS